ncbi:hypothetical protein [Companilactobacillus futsaii]|nr:hypothetical protein [Companilactobacillus futsaii]
MVLKITRITAGLKKKLTTAVKKIISDEVKISLPAFNSLRNLGTIPF